MMTATRKHTPRTRLHRSAGFGLVEIMVALVIGMLGTIVMLQLFAENEARSRNTSGAADAQSNGVITFYQLQSHIQRAGYGLNSVGIYNCRLTWTVSTGNPIGKVVMSAPVSINPTSTNGGVSSLVIPAGDANTDTLVIMYGNGNLQPQGNTIIASTAPSYTVQMPTSFAIGDRVVSAPDITPDSCGTTDLLIDRITNTDANTVTVATGANGAALYNLGPGPNSANIVHTAAAPLNGPTIMAYAVRNGNLTECDFTVYDCSLAANVNSATVWVPIASNIVSLRAVYWKDTSAAWDGTTSVNEQTLPTTACNWARTKGVHLAMVARSDERDKDVVTLTTRNGVSANDANAPTWTQNGIAPLVNTTGTLGPDTVADEGWKHYRYKTFQALIPLRNVAWMGVPTGC